MAPGLLLLAPIRVAPCSESSRRTVSSLSARIRCPLIVVELEKSGAGRVRLHLSRLKIKPQRELRTLALGNKDKSQGVNEERRNKLFSENQEILSTRKPQTYAYLFYFISYLCFCSTCTDRNARWFIFPIEIVGLVTSNAMILSALGLRLTFSRVKREGRSPLEPFTCSTHITPGSREPPLDFNGTNVAKPHPSRSIPRRLWYRCNFGNDSRIYQALFDWVFIII